MQPATITQTVSMASFSSWLLTPPSRIRATKKAARIGRPHSGWPDFAVRPLSTLHEAPEASNRERRRIARRATKAATMHARTR